MFAPQVVGREPVHHSCQVQKAVRGIIGIAEVVRPPAQERVDAHEQVELWNLRVPTQAFHLRLHVPLLLRGDAQTQPACPVRVALPAQVIPQEAEAVVPVREARLLRMLGQPQVLLQPL
jgi:hypothetical protein